MKKIILISVLLLSMLMHLGGCTAQSPKQETAEKEVQAEKKIEKKTPTSTPETLKVALDTSYPPMEYMENGKIVGFSPELMEMLAKLMGKKVEMKQVAWDQIFDGLYGNTYDLILSSVSITEERKSTLLFSDPYFNSTSVVVLPANSSIKNMQDLTQRKIAFQKDTHQLSVVTKQIPSIDVKTYASGEECILAFENKLCEGMVLDAPVAHHYIKNQKDANLIALEDTNLFGIDEFGIVANKDNAALITEINTALHTLKTNGEYNKLYDKYFK